MKYTKLPVNTFEELQLNAGILLSNFSPDTGTASSENILGATSGGVTFTDTPTFKDFGDDIDNCPKNTMELKRVESREITITGTFLTVNTTLAKSLIATADVSSNDMTNIIPRNNIKKEDFKTIWWVGDYSYVNDDTNGGYIAICLNNSLSTGGFSLKSSDRDKGKFAFTYMAHYTLENIEKVPYEIYIKSGTEEA